MYKYTQITMQWKYIIQNLQNAYKRREFMGIFKLTSTCSDFKEKFQDQLSIYIHVLDSFFFMHDKKLQIAHSFPITLAIVAQDKEIC